ncbi:carotenoid oxygenase family protein [Caulobacter segnis]
MSATFYQCGEAYRLDPLTLETPGVAAWALLEGVSAHPKVDEATGELMFFNYSKAWPHMHYGVVDASGKRTATSPCRCPARACRARHGLLGALGDPQRPAGVLGPGPDGQGRPRRAPAQGPAQPLRPRPSRGGEPRWLRGRADLHVLHWLNAYEDGADAVVLDGYFQENPIPRPLESAPTAMAT